MLTGDNSSSIFKVDCSSYLRLNKKEMLKDSHAHTSSTHCRTNRPFGFVRFWDPQSNLLVASGPSRNQLQALRGAHDSLCMIKPTPVMWAHHWQTKGIHGLRIVINRLFVPVIANRCKEALQTADITGCIPLMHPPQWHFPVHLTVQSALTIMYSLLGNKDNLTNYSHNDRPCSSFFSVFLPVLSWRPLQWTDVKTGWQVT